MSTVRKATYDLWRSRGMTTIFGAQANHPPLLITAGQQVCPVITMQANLTNRDATRMPHPLVKWSHEPARAEEVPAGIARGIHTAAMAPKGPAFVSVPMDDWTADAPADAARNLIGRTVGNRAVAAPAGPSLIEVGVAPGMWLA